MDKLLNQLNEYVNIEHLDAEFIDEKFFGQVKVMVGTRSG